MACVEACPVGIEHVPIINQLRRRLVELGELDEALQRVLEKVVSTGNSIGEPRRKRGRWARELPVPIKDARKEPCEYLWFTGDYASFDPRAVQASRALAEVLAECGVDVGMLYEGERSAGCDVRRVGEEGLWQSLAEENIESLSGCDFERILTTDPHTYHALRQEYPQLGGSWSATHHSELLAELLREGRLVLPRPLPYTVTYHDPCFLGRYNRVYEPPRDVLRALGVQLVEMPRNRDNAFCCGAGGGVIWMQERGRAGQAARPAEQRIAEALALDDVTVFVVACPKDASMFNAAVATMDCGDRIVVRELAELVHEALGLGANETRSTGPIAVDPPLTLNVTE